MALNRDPCKESHKRPRLEQQPQPQTQIQTQPQTQAENGAESESSDSDSEPEVLLEPNLFMGEVGRMAMKEAEYLETDHEDEDEDEYDITGKTEYEFFALVIQVEKSS